MRKISTWVLAGAVAGGLGAVPFVHHAVAADSTNQPTNLGNDKADSTPLKLPAGFEEKDVGAVSGVKTGLAKLTERFASKGDFNKMLAELATPDKDRARQYKDVDQDKIDGRIEQISQAWKAKYGKDFDLSDKNVVFDERYAIVQGEVTDPALALADWPVASTNEAVTAASNQPAANGNQKAVDDAASAAKLEKGRNVALIRVPASECLPAVSVSMLHELPMFYRVNIPNDRTGEQIYKDTLTQLTYIGENTDKWPSDVNDAYRMVAHHAIAAVYGVDLNKAAAATVH